jgi:hypothetical protein
VGDRIKAEADKIKAEAELERLRQSPAIRQMGEQEKLNTETHNTYKEAGYSNYVSKGLEETEEIKEPQQEVTTDELTDSAAEDLVAMFTDISDCCRRVIESGMPGHSGYEELNDVLVKTYLAMKAQAEKYDEEQAKETLIRPGIDTEDATSY